MKKLLLLITFILCWSGLALAVSPSGQGWFLVNNCTDITSPASTQSYCVQWSDKSIYYWNSGTSTWILLISGGVTSVTGSGAVSASPTTGAVVVTLTNSGVTVGSYNDASITVDAYGRVTSARNGTVQIAFDYIGSLSSSSNGSQIEGFNCVNALTFAASLSGTVTSCGTAPSESDAYTLTDTSTSTLLGTITVGTGCAKNNTGVTYSGSGGSCSVGDRIELKAPATVSGADVLITVSGSR